MFKSLFAYISYFILNVLFSVVSKEKRQNALPHSLSVQPELARANSSREQASLASSSCFLGSKEEVASTDLATYPGFFKAETQTFLSKKILVVDDTLIIRKQILRMLKMKGFECEQAENGLQAVEAVKEASIKGGPFAFILMDLQMPVMDGQGATLEIRKAGDATPIICMSTLVNDQTEFAQLTTNMDGYLPKQPIKQSNLDSLLMKYFGSTTPKAQAVSGISSPTRSSISSDSRDESSFSLINSRACSF